MRGRARSSFGFLIAVAVAALPTLAHAALGPLELSEAVSLANSLGGLEDYPDANSVTGLDHTYIEFDESGAYEEYNHTFTKVLTEEGRDDNGSVALTYHRRYGSIEIVMARVVKADGTEVVVEEDLITEGTPPAVSAMNIFEADFREISVVFPGLEVGDAIEYIVHQTYKPLIDNGFTGIYFLQYVEPIAESVVTIVGPSSLPLRHIVKNGEAEFTESADGGRTTYTWTTHGSPKIERELAMTPPRQFATRLIVSTMQTWEETSRYVWKMVDEKCVADESIVDLVAEITDGLSTTEDKIRAIHYWILENVRYLGIAMDRGAFLEPHFAAYTLEKEYGICRDKATLMITMLAEIGVPAWMVAINPSHKMDTEIPTIYFEHGIVAIKGPDGGYLYIDPTIEETREVYASYVGDRYLLVATEEGEDLRQAPHVPATANSGDITDRAVLDRRRKHRGRRRHNGERLLRADTQDRQQEHGPGAVRGHGPADDQRHLPGGRAQELLGHGRRRPIRTDHRSGSPTGSTTTRWTPGPTRCSGSRPRPARSSSCPISSSGGWWDSRSAGTRSLWASRSGSTRDRRSRFPTDSALRICPTRSSSRRAP